MRVRKFLARGYNIQASSLAAVVARLVMAVRMESLPYKRHGGQPDRTEEEAISFALKGLLHEVDPLLVLDGLDPIDENEAINKGDDAPTPERITER